MKVFTATRESQGARERDLWADCVEGELVRPLEERCAAAPGEDCSCGTAFLGLASGGLTSTATVTDLPREERSFVVPARYAAELARVARRLRRDGVVERDDEWIGLRFATTGRCSRISPPSPTSTPMSSTTSHERGGAVRRRRPAPPDARRARAGR